MLTRPVLCLLVSCLCLAAPSSAGEVIPQGSDFVVESFRFGAPGAGTAMSADGAFIVVWDAIFCCMAARGYDEDLNSWMWHLTPGFPTTWDSIDVAALASDDFAVAWESEDQAFNEVIHARRFSISGTPLGPSVEVVSSVDGSTNVHPAVEAWQSSYFLVAWTQDDPNDPEADGLDIQIAAVRTDAPAGHFMVNTYATGDQEYPELSVGADSSFVVVWRSAGSPGNDSDGRSIQATWFSPSGYPGPQFQVNSNTTGDQENADVAMAPDGRFLVVWDGTSTGSDVDRGIQGRLFGADQVPLGLDFQINSRTRGTQSQPAVESRPDGSFYVVWRSSSGVFGRVVGPEGAPLGLETQLNSTVGDQYSNPRVAVGGLDGKFVVTWDSDDDYSYYGHARRARLFQDPLFSDGFESGDTSAWSMAVP